MIKVKICGITRGQDAELASRLGADALGFIFVRESRRYLSAPRAKKIVDCLGPFTIKVGVFSDADKKTVSATAGFLGLDVLQFHGSESPQYCNFFRPKFKVIKVFFPQDMPFSRSVRRYDVDAYLFDVKQKDKKNGLKRLPPQAYCQLRQLVKKGVRVIISGGLSADNLSAVKKLKPYAVDIASGVERAPGIKSKSKMTDFITKVKQAL